MKMNLNFTEKSSWAIRLIFTLEATLISKIVAFGAQKTQKWLLKSLSICNVSLCNCLHQDFSSYLSEFSSLCVHTQIDTNITKLETIFQSIHEEPLPWGIYNFLSWFSHIYLSMFIYLAISDYLNKQAYESKIVIIYS